MADSTTVTVEDIPKASMYPEVADATPVAPVEYAQPVAYPAPPTNAAPPVTVAPVGAAPFVPQVIGASTQWENSLFGCFSDCGTCCYGFFCPCCLFGNTYEKVGSGGSCGGCCLYYLTALFCLQGCIAMGNRQQIRTQHGLEGSDCNACCAHTLCSSCAVCQDAREVKYQTSKQQQFATVPATMPPPNQAMTP